MTPRDDLDIRGLDAGCVHQSIQVAHPVFERQAPTEVERGVRRCRHPHALGEAYVVLGQLVAAHNHVVLGVGVCADDLGGCLWVQPFRAVHGGCRHTAQRRAGGQPRGSSFERSSQLHVATEIDVAVDRPKPGAEVIACELATP
jgi:hypothetical protein